MKLAAVVDAIKIRRLRIRKKLDCFQMSKFFVYLQNVPIFYEFVAYEFL